jgi:glutathione S-transferase
MITLYNFGPFQGLADPSPFCLKVDCYMRAAGIEFETKSGANYIGKSPKHKLPYIEDDGEVIGDSSFIIDHCKEKYGDVLDQDLNAEQKAIARAFIKMLDENLYWCIVQSRWIGEGWPTMKEEFFGKMPLPLRMVVPTIAQKGMKKSLHQHGLGRHSEQEILDIGSKDVKALADFLGTKDYFLINKPTTLDICAFAFLAEMIVPEMKCELNEVAKSFSNLVNFVKRMKTQFYSD